MLQEGLTASASLARETGCRVMEAGQILPHQCCRTTITVSTTRLDVITMTPRRPALEQLEGIAGQALVAAKAVGAPMRADTVAANSADRIRRKSAKAANTLI